MYTLLQFSFPYFGVCVGGGVVVFSPIWHMLENVFSSCVPFLWSFQV